MLEDIYGGFDDENDIYAGLQANDDDGEAIYDLVVDQNRTRRGGKEFGTKRDHIKAEVQETEGSYLDSIKEVVKTYKSKMSDLRSRPREVSADDVATIFINIEQLIPIHETIFQRLKRGEPTGRVYHDARHGLLDYVDYVARLSDAKTRLESICKSKAVAEYLVRLQQTSTLPKFSLKDLLSLPFQRIMRYKMLLEALAKATDESHSGFRSLKRAIGAVSDVAKCVDVATGDWEDAQDGRELARSIVGYPGHLPEINSYGRILITGDLKLKIACSSRAAEKRIVYVMDQVVLVAMKEKKKQKYMYIMDLQNFDAIPEAVKGKQVGIKMVANRAGQQAGDDQFNGTLIFRTTKQRTAWLQPLHEAKQRLTPPSGRGGCKWHLQTFGKGVRCSNCQCLLWGLVSQGYTCRNSGCTEQVHEHCLALCTAACAAGDGASAGRQVTVRDRGAAQRHATQRRRGGGAAAGSDGAGPAVSGRGGSQRIAGRRASQYTSTVITRPPTVLPAAETVPYEGYEQQVTQTEGSWQPGETVLVRAVLRPVQRQCGVARAININRLLVCCNKCWHLDNFRVLQKC